MAKRFVEYRGVRMVEGWPERIQHAQLLTLYHIDGRAVARITYGSEESDWGADKLPCHDCRVFKNEYHVLGCDVEECPVCGGQILTCDCAFDERESLE